jgi:hypothetical protein
MIVERLPEVLSLATEEKEILAEELLNQVYRESNRQTDRGRKRVAPGVGA